MKVLFVTILLFTAAGSLYAQDRSPLLPKVEKREIRHEGQVSETNPLYVIWLSGRKLEFLRNESPEDSIFLRQLQPVWIESVDVLKGPDGVEKYGPDGKEGVVIVQLKEAYLDEMPEEFVSRFKEE